VDRHARAERSGTRPQRALRGAAAAAISTVVAGTAHTLAGGGAPPWWLVVVVAALAAPVAVWLVGRRLTLRGTASAVMVAQLGLHAAFAAVGPDGPSSAASAAASAHNAHHPALASFAPATLSPVSGALTGHLHLDPGMIAAHLLAAALTVALLLRGETLVRALARGIRRILGRSLPVLAVPAVRALAVRRASASARPVFLSALSRRGPPAFAR